MMTINSSQITFGEKTKDTVSGLLPEPISWWWIVWLLLLLFMLWRMEVLWGRG